MRTTQRFAAKRQRLLVDRDRIGTLALQTHHASDVVQVSANIRVPGAEGDFGVLPGHAPLISAVRPGISTTDQREQGCIAAAEARGTRRTAAAHSGKGDWLPQGACPPFRRSRFRRGSRHCRAAPGAPQQLTLRTCWKIPAHGAFSLPTWLGTRRRRMRMKDRTRRKSSVTRMPRVVAPRSAAPSSLSNVRYVVTPSNTPDKLMNFTTELPRLPIGADGSKPIITSIVEDEFVPGQPLVITISGEHFGDVWRKNLISPLVNEQRLQTDRFSDWMADRFNNNDGWDRIVTDLDSTLFDNRPRQARIQAAIPAHVAAEADRQAGRDHLEHTAERVTLRSGGVHGRNHARLGRTIERAQRRGVRGGVQVIGPLRGRPRLDAHEH